MDLHTKWIEKPITYTGAELRSHWLAEQTGFFSSLLVAFRGPCRVKTPDLVDLEDAWQSAEIRAKEMLHFVGEFFREDLLLSIVRQRLLVGLFSETLQEMAPAFFAGKLLRRGDDLYYSPESGEKKKLSVSIVTAAPTSTLLHFGVNIDSSGAPVKAQGLGDCSIDVQELALRVLSEWKKEICSQQRAYCKVLPR